MTTAVPLVATISMELVSFYYYCFWIVMGLLIVDCFNVEAERTETVVATDHRAHRVFHPAIEEIAFASGQWLHELTH